MNKCMKCKYMAAPRFNGEKSTCTRIIHGNEDMAAEERSRGELAVVVDGSGYAARLLVSGDFGCVLWEKK